tara:strand:- start:467 stop:862 length:396 start_codon:yes stop_codon:yes gene_type:complete
MKEYMVLCEDGGENFDVAMFKIYEKKQNTARSSFHYNHKLNKKEYIKFINKNKKCTINLYIDNAMIINPLEDVDERARTLKYGNVFRETLKEVKNWMLMFEHLEIIGLKDILNKISNVLHGNRERKDINNH